MAYVLTNGSYYVRMTKTSGEAKTKDIKEARITGYRTKRVDGLIPFNKRSVIIM